MSSEKVTLYYAFYVSGTSENGNKIVKDKRNEVSPTQVITSWLSVKGKG